MVIFPERKQRVQTARVRVPPPTLARTRWMFGYWRRLLTLWAWLI